MDHGMHKGEGARAIAISFAAALALAAPLAQAATKTMTVEQTTVQAVTVPPSDLKLSLWTDRSKGIYADGDKARVFLKVNQTARVELLDVNSTGVKTVLFPNACQPDNLVQANKPVEVGIGGNCNGIRVSAPFGLSLLKATATTGNTTPLAGKTTRSASPFGEYAGSAADYARGMTVIISQAPQAKWATASLNYSVIPAAGAAITVPAVSATQVVITDPATSTTVQVIATPPGTPTAVVVPAPAAQVAVIQQAEFSLPPLKSDFAMTLSTGESSYRAGETLSFSVASEKRCDLHVVSIDEKGDYNILYPNARDTQLTLEPGKTLFLPRSGGDVQIKLAGSPGKQTLLAVCPQNKSFWDSVLGRSGALGDRAAIAAVQPTLTLEQLLSNKGDGQVGRKAVTFQISE